MRKKNSSMDGFVPRRSRRSIGGASESSIGSTDGNTTIDHAGESSRPLRRPDEKILPRPQAHVSRKEIDESLQSIDDDDEPKKRRHSIFRRKVKKPQTRKRKIIKWAIRLFIIIILIVGAYVAIQAMRASSSIFKGDLFGLFQNKPLKMDTNGRTNVLILGTSGSAEDKVHAGADLTDTLLVLSIDQEKKDAYMVSLPRDLWVEYGQACPEGYQGKINSLYACFSEGGTKEAAGVKALKKKVTEVTGLDLQYYAHVNWAVVASAVKAVGGVKVKVEGNGSCAGFGMPEGSVVDVNMRIRLKPGMQKMNSDQALRFSRARGSAGGCGLNAGDFDRQQNQQKVIIALKDKATSAETLTNVGKVTALIDSLGENLATDFETAEVRTLISLTKDIPTDQITSLSLIEEENRLIVSAAFTGISAQQPALGLYEYGDIHAFIRKKVSSDKVVREEAKVVLLNATGVEGYAGTQSDTLTAKNFTISTVGNAPAGKYEAVEIYDLAKGKKPATAAKLASIYGVTIKETAPSFYVAPGTDIVVVFGKAKTATSEQ